MRIIAGKYRGLRLSSPKGRRVRPTGERVREAIFSIIGVDLSGLWVLDLFAGTAAMGLEALSRGASFVVLVDQHPAAAKLISKNLAACGNPETVNVFRLDLRRGLKAFAGRGWSFDLVFLDPPYGRGLSQSCLTQLGSGGLLRSPATVICEHSIGESLSSSYGSLQRQMTRHYGNTAVSFYGLENE